MKCFFIVSFAYLRLDLLRRVRNGIRFGPCRDKTYLLKTLKSSTWGEGGDGLVLDKLNTARDNIKLHRTNKRVLNILYMYQSLMIGR